ncbi:MAG: DUF494 domain-containing protein [Calditerrivibrio sp.]|nr:DUF494 domain-containing protein [Calditerrivibrio sp.]
MDKIFIALNIIIDYIDSSKKIDEVELTDKLVSFGFGDHEIRQAMSIFDIKSYDGVPYYRSFTKKELSKLSPETMLFIQKLYLYGVLEPEIIEESIDRASDTNTQKISLETYKNILLFTLMDSRNLYVEHIENDEDFS